MCRGQDTAAGTRFPLSFAGVLMHPVGRFFSGCVNVRKVHLHGSELGAKARGAAVSA